MNRLPSELVASQSLDLFKTWLDPGKPHQASNMLLLEQEVGAEELSNVTYSLILQLHQSKFWMKIERKQGKFGIKHNLDKLAEPSIISKNTPKIREGEHRKLLSGRRKHSQLYNGKRFLRRGMVKDLKVSFKNLAS